MTPHQTKPPPSTLRFSARRQDGFTIVTLTGELDIGCAPVLREQLLGLLRGRAARLIIDLSRVTFCDASGLAVLVGTARRARLIGGVLRLAAPAPDTTAALRITGLGRQFDIFATVPAAITNSLAGRRVPHAGGHDPAPVGRPGPQRPRSAAPRRAAAAPDSNSLRGAVTAVLAHADAWRDADPNRRLTLSLDALARAHAGADRTALVEAARSLLTALVRHPLTHSPAVAETATGLRRLVDSRSYHPSLN